MPGELSFDIVEWLPPLAGEPPEVSATSALLQIAAGGHLVTRAEDDLARTLRSTVRTSAYPLALWLTANWWRLRWEPLPSGNRKPSVDWQMSHRMPAAGHGFLWPDLEFASDGADGLELSCRPSPRRSSEPLRFLQRFRARVAAASFERASLTFVEQVVHRLRETDQGAAPLCVLWQTLRAERKDLGLAASRKLEAMAGFDPEEAPAEISEALDGVAREAGGEAAAEIASALAAGGGVSEGIQHLRQVAATPGLQATMPAAGDVSGLLRRPELASGRAHPAARGEWLAREARAHWRLGDGRVDDATLSGLLGFSDGLRQAGGQATPPPVGFGVREDDAGRTQLHLRGRTRHDRRFEAGRLLCDHATTPPSERWLLATAAATGRQQMQRAFSAELFAPIGPLLDYLGDERSDDAMGRAAEHFDIAPLVVRNQLANHGELPRAGV